MRLLAMLEPPVRPGNTPAAAARLMQRAEGDEAALPIEQRSFDALLRGAQTHARELLGRDDPANSASGPDDATPHAAHKPSTASLAFLAGLDRIENASARHIHSARLPHEAVGDGTQ
jgi:hypothetical protein